MRKSGRRSKRIDTGIRRRPNGNLEAYVESRGRTRSKVFPKGTPIQRIKTWRLLERDRLGAIGGARGGLESDVQRYLQMVQDQKTLDDTTYILGRWMRQIGPTRSRSTVTTDELHRITQDMTGGGLSPASIRRYLGTLQRMWTVLDGPGAPNPVRGVQRPQKDPVQARGLPPEVVQQLLDTMEKDDEWAICRVMAWTGLTGEQIRSLQPEHIYWDQNSVQTIGRRKGRTAAGRILPLLPMGVEALREFDARNLYGKVVNAKIWRRVKRAGKAIGRPSIRPYDLRHSFATAIYESSSDLSITAYLLGHQTTASTKRYALNAFEKVARSTVEKAGHELEARLRPGTDIDHPVRGTG